MNRVLGMPRTRSLYLKQGDASAKGIAVPRASSGLVSQDQTPTGDASVNARFPQMA
ncbi:hypothetical protein SAMN05216417_12821 [Nitrosospira multiformis]|uniref:Uncharacterized protein n=1 Tax=Nitrosospira multiformis TaxID=1231 RepID=A0A1I7IVN1_9PROT|nr:hypothetical protein SAMN05216417_12821 [Nitrosospira multiformis]